MTAKKLQLEDLQSPIRSRRRQEEAFPAVGVIGLGIMGQGIAETVANAGMEVTAVEKTPERLQEGLDGLARALDQEIRRWSRTESEKRAIMSRVKGTVSLTDLRDCAIVIEAVDESYDVKRQVIHAVDEVARPDAAFISNTSTLSLSKLAQDSRHPDRIIGMHFLNPVPKVPVVEIVRAMKTSDETFNRVRKFAEQLGKTPVEVFEYPGFITTRTILPMINEAAHVLMEGIARAEDIDTAMKLGYGMQAGPLEMADGIGLDEVLMWMETLFHELGEPRYRPCPLIRKMVRERKLGKKVNEGFFTYNEDGKRIRP